MTFIHIHPTSSQLYPALVIKHSYWKWFIEIIDLPDLSMVNLPIKPELIGGIPTPLKNMSSSDWIIIPTELGKIKAMFQTTNQDIIVLVGWHPIEKVDLRDLNMVNLHEFSYETRESPVIFHINHGFPMVFPWFSHGFPRVFPWSPAFSELLHVHLQDLFPSLDIRQRNCDAAIETPRAQQGTVQDVGTLDGER